MEGLCNKIMKNSDKVTKQAAAEWTNAKAVNNLPAHAAMTAMNPEQETGEVEA